ncbi:MAG: Dabb family protein [Clostridia bacterium]|nr:Dabb family protein [Clostridia bacterium]
MVKHIVFWNIKQEVNGETKEQIMLRMKEMLEALNGKIPGLIKAEVGIDKNRSQAAFDICLYSEFPDWESLNFYQDHPLHVACKDYIGAVAEERAVCDYE